MFVVSVNRVLGTGQESLIRIGATDQVRSFAADVSDLKDKVLDAVLPVQRPLLGVRQSHLGIDGEKGAVDSGFEWNINRKL